MSPPQINPTIRCCSQHLMVGFFFFDLFSYSGLRAFFTSDFMNCTTDYVPPKLTQPSGAVHSIWWLGFFFDFFSYSGLRAFFTSDFTNCTTDYVPSQITPTIRCCSQHLMVGFFFFLTSSPILDLEHFSQVILRIVLQIMPPPKLPQPSGAVQSIWWLGFFFLTSSLILDLEHFSQVILWIVLQIMPLQINPTIRCCSQHLMVGFFFLTSSPILDLEHFSQVILWIVLQIMSPPPKLTQPSGAVHSIWWLGFFFDLFSYSGLRAFFTSDFTNCTTDYAPSKLTQPSGAVHSIWWLGFFFFHKLFYELYYRLCPSKLTQPSGASGWVFFLTSSPILDLEHFSQVILWIVLQIMSPPQINPTIRCCSEHLMVGFFFWPLLLFWT